MTAPCQSGSSLGFSSLVAPVLPQHLQFPCSRCCCSRPPMPPQAKSNQQRACRSSSTRRTARFISICPEIVAGMANDVRAALGKYETILNRVVLFLDSAGGSVDDGDRVIEALNEIKLRHQLITVVPHG